MTTLPSLVSIVLATYNGECFLAEQIESLLNQTYQNLEIIALDDNSSDNTWTILQNYAQQDKRLHIIRNETNIGVIKNFEHGFLLAQGEYIAPCDQDDIWLPYKIEVLVNATANSAMVYGDSAFINSAGERIGQNMSDIKNMTDFDNPLMYIELGISALGHALLVKKSVVLAAIPFPTLFFHDNWLGFIASFHGGVKFVNQILVEYRRHDSNLTNALSKKDRKRIAGKKANKQQRILQAQERLQTMYQRCPADLPEKMILARFCQSHHSYSLNNNLLRAYLFFKYRTKILRHKKYRYPAIKQTLHAIKAFYKMIL